MPRELGVSTNRDTKIWSLWFQNILATRQIHALACVPSNLQLYDPGMIERLHAEQRS